MPENNEFYERGVVPDDDLCAAVAKYVSLYGTYACAKMLDVSSESIARCMARLPLYTKTLARMRKTLRAKGLLR